MTEEHNAFFLQLRWLWLFMHVLFADEAAYLAL
jgi:hypothetical protein